MTGERVALWAVICALVLAGVFQAGYHFGHPARARYEMRTILGGVPARFDNETGTVQIVRPTLPEAPSATPQRSR